jgi:hypothetical protein
VTSPLSTFFTELRRRWELKIAPSDSTGLPYRQARVPGALGGASAHRTWTYDRKLRRRGLTEQAGQTFGVRYVVFPILRIHRLGRDEEEWLAAIADETEILLQAWSLDATPWSSDGSIREVLFEQDFNTEFSADEARCVFTVHVEIRRGGT